MAEEFAAHYARIVDKRFAVGGREAHGLLDIVVVELALPKNQNLLELLRLILFVKVCWESRSVERFGDGVAIVLQTAGNTGL
jgi:hypothetical protein